MSLVLSPTSLHVVSFSGECPIHDVDCCGGRDLSHNRGGGGCCCSGLDANLMHLSYRFRGSLSPLMEHLHCLQIHSKNWHDHLSFECFLHLSHISQIICNKLILLYLRMYLIVIYIHLSEGVAAMSNKPVVHVLYSTMVREYTLPLSHQGYGQGLYPASGAPGIWAGTLPCLWGTMNMMMMSYKTRP